MFYFYKYFIPLLPQSLPSQQPLPRLCLSYSFTETLKDTIQSAK